MSKGQYCVEACQVLSGIIRLDNRIDVISISACDKPNKNKNVIIITARAHPVETVSSFVMKGIIEFLTSEAE